MAKKSIIRKGSRDQGSKGSRAEETSKSRNVKKSKGRKANPSLPHCPRARAGGSDSSIPSAAIGSLVVQRVPVAQIKPAAYNPRKQLRPGDPEYIKLHRSIEKFGYVDTLVWNKQTGNLVGGHQRFAILVNEYGATEIDVAVVDLPPGEEKTLNLALNKITGDWDDLALATLLTELESMESNGDSKGDSKENLCSTRCSPIALTGFDELEIELLLADTELTGESKEDLCSTRMEDAYRVVANCVDAKQQAQVQKMLKGKGIACHLLTNE